MAFRVFDHRICCVMSCTTESSLSVPDLFHDSFAIPLYGIMFFVRHGWMKALALSLGRSLWVHHVGRFGRRRPRKTPSSSSSRRFHNVSRQCDFKLHLERDIPLVRRDRQFGDQLIGAASLPRRTRCPSARQIRPLWLFSSFKTKIRRVLLESYLDTYYSTSTGRLCLVWERHFPNI